MGRRSRRQDTTQVANVDQSVGSQDNQLQEMATPAPVETVKTEESAAESKPVEEIPYDDRPIPEAYFPPEDETPAPVTNVQEQTEAVPTAKYKYVSKKTLDALKFAERPAEAKVAEVKPTEHKPEVKETPVAAKNIDLNALQFEAKTVVPKDTTRKPAEKEEVVVADVTPVAKDSLIAQNDTLANDSLASDSIAFIPVEKPVIKREIISIDGKEKPETVGNMWWYHPILLVLFIAYVIIIRDRKKAILSEWLSFIKPNTDGSIFGFQWLQNSKYKFFLSVLGVITLSLYLFLANSVPISGCWIFFLAVTVFIVGKKIMLALLEYIYFEGANVASMSQAFMVMVRQAGLMLVPSVLGLSFAPETYRHFFVYLGIFIVGVAILAFNFKVIVNFLRGITSIFYLILYLCTLEVIPVALFFVLGLLPRL